MPNLLKYPLLICDQNTLYCAGEEFITPPYSVDWARRVFTANVSRTGKAHFEWIMEADGTWHEFKSLGLLPATLWQQLRLFRRKEAFELLPARKLTVRELLLLAANLHDTFEEAPMVADLKELLQSKNPTSIVDEDCLREYLHGTPP